MSDATPFEQFFAFRRFQGARQLFPFLHDGLGFVDAAAHQKHAQRDHGRLNGSGEQVASLGPNRVNVIVPVGLAPPLIVAVSLTPPGMATAEDACVVRIGVAALIVTDSLGLPQAPLEAELSPSPE